MELSFVIPCFNSEVTIEKTLESIFSQDNIELFEVIVVDNGSSDNTINILKNFPVTLLHEQRRGANFARNCGAKNAKGKYIAFVDSDVILDNKWAANLMSYIKRHDLLAAMGQVIRIPYKNRKSLLESYRCSVSPSHFSPWISLVERGFINTAACIYRSDVLYNLNYFSESFIVLEDVDLSFKLRAGAVGKIGATESSIARCTYPFGLSSYLKREIIHSYYYIFLFKKWGHQIKTPEFFNHSNMSYSLDMLLRFFRGIGHGLGNIMQHLNSSDHFARECLQWKKIGLLPNAYGVKMYFEDKEIQTHG